MSDKNKTWEIKFSNKARKQKELLPDDISPILDALTYELKTEGPERRNWPHCGNIKGQGKKTDMRHCHLNKSRPVYVVVWVVVDNDVQIMEVRYVGPHEHADYRRIS
ncbi:MAG: cytotoxic translational repressor of toxin-antitoxin stability system [Candidatus Adiutrix sp.]|jgi:mRNA-degrading endonuclease RelE of RelBE toxin-antitoxin system|nr:cytotoxic translational repressor of toxin-antitoxin stability system [Candidatus Adiutrix sp.]